MSIWKRIKIGLKVASVGLKVAAGVLKTPLGLTLGKIADGIDQIEPQLPESAQHGGAIRAESSHRLSSAEIDSLLPPALRRGECGPDCRPEACDLETHSAEYRRRARQAKTTHEKGS